MTDIRAIQASAKSAHEIQFAAPGYTEYRQNFIAREVKSLEELRQVRRLRYQVYCVENAFEDPSRFPTGEETDEFDVHSSHILLIHRRSGIAVGTLRIVFPTLESLQGGLPVMGICEALAKDPEVSLPRASTVELSRFAISKQFWQMATGRCHANDGAPQQQIDDDRRIAPLMGLGLIGAALQIGLEAGITHVCAAMEPALLRLLKRNGFHFQTLGPLIQYHGWRQPCYAEVANVLEHLRGHHPEVWTIVTANRPAKRHSVC